MADRTAAKIFGKLFEELARYPEDPTRRDIARTVAGWMPGYDFSPVQTGATEAMEALGVGRWTDDGEDASFEILAT